MAATAPAKPEAPPAAETAPPPPAGPWSERELQWLLNEFPAFDSDQVGTRAWLRVPRAERSWWAAVRAEMAALKRPLEEARDSVLKGEAVAEYRRRAAALRSAQAQALHFTRRLAQLAAERQAALAAGDDAALAAAEASTQQAREELARYEDRAAALPALVEQAQAQAAAALKAAVNAAHHGVVMGAARERDAARRALAEVAYKALVPLLEKQARWEHAADRTAADELSRLPEEKTGT
jgi:hypothetical protein